MKFVWKGPSTAIELFPVVDVKEAVAKEKEIKPIFSGVVATDAEIPADLPEGHPDVKGWLAFKLIAPVATPATAAPESAGKKTKEAANG